MEHWVCHDYTDLRPSILSQCLCTMAAKVYLSIPPDIPYNISETLRTPSGTVVPSRLVFDTQNSTEVTRTLSFTGPGVEFVDTVTVYARVRKIGTPCEVKYDIHSLVPRLSPHMTTIGCHHIGRGCDVDVLGG